MNGHEFYDDPEIFATYWARRAKPDYPNETIEEPVIRAMVGPPDGLHFLDLGCGDARYGEELLRGGCAAYVGLEASQKMMEAASRRLSNPKAELHLGSMEDWDFGQARFEVVVSRMAIHYIEGLPDLLARVHRALVSGGRFIFSTEHPCITASYEDNGDADKQKRGNWIVDRYFLPGPRSSHWLGGSVSKHHRTFSDYFNLLGAAGFIITDLSEGRPRRENFVNEETFRQWQRVPTYLMMNCRKTT